jgi:ketosteroid isomerase-like protein
MLELDAVLDEFSAAFGAQDTERLKKAFVGDHASLVTSEGLALIGTDRLHLFFDVYAQQETRFTFEWDYREVHAEGDAGWIVAFGRETASRPDGDVTMPFRLTLVCRRTPGSGWGIAHLHASSPA